jgi:hypothetical protein
MKTCNKNENMKLCQNHFAVEIVSVNCTPKPLDVLNVFQQMNKTKDLESLPSFSFRLTQLEEGKEMVSVSCTPKPFCCGNGFCELYCKTILLWKWFL